MEERKVKRIIMFPLPFTGHFNPMIELAGIFHNRGFSVTILHTSFNFPDPSRHPQFTFRTITHKNEGEEDPLSQSETSSGKDLVVLISLLKQCYTEPFRQSLAEEVGEGGTVCCLVSDALWGRNTEIVAKEIGVRTMVMRTSGAATFCAYTAFPLLIDKGYLPIQGNIVLC